MNAAPLVSVVMPAYNAGPFISASIQSVLAQRHGALELIVVDDASKDDTRRIAEGYASDPRVKVLANARRKGPSGARNTGLLAASGDFIAFLDSDDLWLPDHLEHAIAFFAAHPDVDVVMFDFDIVDAGTGRKTSHWFGERCFHEVLETRVLENGYRLVVTDMFEALVTEGFVHVQALVARRRATEGVLFAEDIMRSEDRDWAIRVTSGGGPRFAFHPRVTGIYHRHANSLTTASAHANEATARDEVHLFGRYLDQAGLAPSLRARLRRKLAGRLLDVAYYRRQAGDPAAAWGNVVASLEHEIRPRHFVEFAKIAASWLLRDRTPVSGK